MIRGRSIHWTRLGLLASLTLALSASRSLPLGAPPDRGVELTFLANEGFLVRAEEASFLIDAFVPTPYSIYGGLSEAAREAMLNGRAPFDEVDLVLVSHFHTDHWQPEFARKTLLAVEGAQMIACPQVIEGLEAAGPVIPDRAHELLPPPGERVAYELGGLIVDAFRLSHGSGRFDDVENVAHLVQLGGMKLLHMGDATLGVDPEPFALADEKIDIALVPYWWLEDAAASKALREDIAPRHVVAVHVPPREVEALRKRLKVTWPDAHVFDECLESRRYEPAPK